MLGHVLEADKFPFAVIAVRDADAKQKNTTLAVAITLHGYTRTFKVPSEIESDDKAIACRARSRSPERLRHHALFAARRRDRGKDACNCGSASAPNACSMP